MIILCTQSILSVMIVVTIIITRVKWRRHTLKTHKRSIMWTAWVFCRTSTVLLNVRMTSTWRHGYGAGTQNGRHCETPMPSTRCACNFKSTAQAFNTSCGYAVYIWIWARVLLFGKLLVNNFLFWLFGQSLLRHICCWHGFFSFIVTNIITWQFW